MKSEDTLFMLYVLRITLQLDIRPSFISAFIHDTVLHTDVAIEEEPVASGAAGVNDVVAIAAVDFNRLVHAEQRDDVVARAGVDDDATGGREAAEVGRAELHADRAVGAGEKNDPIAAGAAADQKFGLARIERIGDECRAESRRRR